MKKSMYAYGGRTLKLVWRSGKAIYAYLGGYHSIDGSLKTWAKDRNAVSQYTEFQREQYDEVERQRKEQNGK